MRVLWLMGLSGCVFVTDADQQAWQATHGDNDGDGYVASEDCDDADAGVHPGHAEVCDGKDEDCDDNVDEGADDFVTSYADADEDGYGDPDVSTTACLVPSGYVENADDCDDGDDTISPETVWYADVDGDGYGDPDDAVTTCAPDDTGLERILEAGDCDDDAEDINPGGTESCNETDDDCDDAIDETISEVDEDGDGYGFCDDCDDDDAERHPDRFEWNDDKDNDCDGEVDVNDLGSADVLIKGEDVLQAMGYLAAGVGDVNQDGFDDVLVGAYLQEEDDRGAAHLVLGGEEVSGVVEARMVFEGPNANAQAGWWVDGAGDIDRDGIPDMLIGAHYVENSDGEAVGAAYLIYGSDLDFSTGSDGEVLNLSKYVELLGDQNDGKTGRSACGAGDVDGDGFDDLIVGAVHNQSETGKSRAGVVYLLTGTPLADLELEEEYDGVVRGLNTKDRIGRWCRTSGDLEGDGIDDLVMGMPYLNSEAGQVLVYSGDDEGIGERTVDDADVELTASLNDGLFGWAVDASTDINGDGYIDLVVGNPKENTEVGEVRLVWGPIADVDLEDPDIIWDGENAGDNAGNRVRIIHDMDGDGEVELAVGARLSDRSEDNAGTVYLWRDFSEGTHSLADAEAFLDGDVTVDDAQAGLSLDEAGDFNGDGFMDLLVGSPNAEMVGHGAVIFGGE